MGGVHVVEFAFEFEAQLDFFFMVLRVLVVVFLKLKPKLFLIHPLTVKLFTVLLQRILVFLPHKLILRLIIKLLLILFL